MTRVLADNDDLSAGLPPEDGQALAEWLVGDDDDMTGERRRPPPLGQQVIDEVESLQGANGLADIDLATINIADAGEVAKRTALVKRVWQLSSQQASFAVKQELIARIPRMASKELVELLKLLTRDGELAAKEVLGGGGGGFTFQVIMGDVPPSPVVIENASPPAPPALATNG